MYAGKAAFSFFVRMPPGTVFSTREVFTELRYISTGGKYWTHLEEKFPGQNVLVSGGENAARIFGASPSHIFRRTTKKNNVTDDA